MNVAFDTELPEELKDSFRNGAEGPLRAWAMKQLEDLLDGECEVEFGAELLGVQIRTQHGR